MTATSVCRRIVATLAAACLVVLLAPHPSTASPRAASTAALPAPVVGPEMPVSEPVNAPAPWDHQDPSAAFDGENHLVVWSEYSRGGGSHTDVWGARVTPSGVVLDLAGIAIATGVASDVRPQVSFGGGTFLVVWTAQTDDGSDVFGTRVDRSDSVLDPSGISIGVLPGTQTSPDVTFGDDTFLVVWSDRGSDQAAADMSGARVDPAGVVRDPGGIRISVTESSSFDGSVAYGDGVFLVTWTAYPPVGLPAVVGARVDLSGSVLDPAPRPISSGAGAGDHAKPAVAFNGTDFLVVWESWDQWARVLGARIAPSGARLDPSAIAIAPSAQGHQLNPVVASSGTSFLVAWYGNSTGEVLDVLGARVDADGRSLDPDGLVLSSAASRYVGRLTLAPTGSGYFAAWEDHRFGGERSHIFGAAIGPDGSASPAVNIDRAANEQHDSVIGFDGQNHLVIWSDNRSGGGFDLYGARLSSTGEMLDPSDFLIASDIDGAFDLAFDGENFLVVWTSGQRAFTVRVSGSGDVLDPPITMPSMLTARAASVAFNGTDFLVSWGDSARAGSDLRAARVSRAGSLLDPAGILVAEDSGGSDIASDGHDFLLTWSTGHEVLGSRLAADGSLLDPTPFVINGTAEWRNEATVAWNGEVYLVVSSGYGADGQPSEVIATRVGRDGAVSDPDGIVIATTGSQDGPTPEVAANGPFLVVWRDRRDDGDVVLGARIGDDGVVLDQPAFVVGSSPSDVGGPTVSAGPGGWAVGYSRYVADPPYGAHRAFVRTVTPK